MKPLLIVVAWVVFTGFAGHFVPERTPPQPIAYVAPDVGQVALPASAGVPRDLARSFPPLPTTSAPTTTTTARPRSAPTPRYSAPNGSCAEWVAAAGIVDTSSAFRLIALESGCDPYIKNRYSGACGVAQELPCGKSGCVLGDGACQVAWMRDYVAARYGSFANAVSFRLSEGWY